MQDKRKCTQDQASTQPAATELLSLETSFTTIDNLSGAGADAVQRSTPILSLQTDERGIPPVFFIVNVWRGGKGIHSVGLTVRPHRGRFIAHGRPLAERFEDHNFLGDAEVWIQLMRVTIGVPYMGRILIGTSLNEAPLRALSIQVTWPDPGSRLANNYRSH